MMWFILIMYSLMEIADEDFDEQCDIGKTKTIIVTQSKGPFTQITVFLLLNTIYLTLHCLVGQLIFM